MTLKIWFRSNRRSTASIAFGGLFEWIVVKEAAGFIEAEVRGKSAKPAFEGEPGGHRWQRVPPTERNGRVHTSTITVAVFDRAHAEPKNKTFNKKDVSVSFYSGTGKGGQFRNKHQNCVRLVHKETGIEAKCEAHREKTKNLDQAFRLLEARINEETRKQEKETLSVLISNQVGSGQRGDKRRTIAITRDDVVDHKNNWRISYKRYERGDW